MMDSSITGDASSITGASQASWGPMGGTIGSGVPTNVQTVPTNMMSPMQSPQVQQQPGSITRFASPQGMSFAERSAQAYAAVGGQQPMMHGGMQQQGMPQQQQEMPQQQQGMQQSYIQQSYMQQPAQQPQYNAPSYASQSAAAPGSYAARSAQAHANPTSSFAGGSSFVSAQPQQQQQQQFAAGSYAQRSMQAQQQQGYRAPQQQQQQQGYVGSNQSVQGSVMSQSTMPTQQQHFVGNMPTPQQPQPPRGLPTPQDQAIQQRMLTDATRKVQEHAYYMKQAMEQSNLPVALDRAAHMVGELGALPHGQQAASNNPASSNASGPTNSGLATKLTPKNYYELYMRALEEMPTFEDYLVNLARPSDQIQIVASAQATPQNFTMRELYGCVQYCPRVLPRIYLQIAAGSALIRSGEVGAKWVLNDLIQAVRCEQNPIRGLFLRHHLLTAFRDKLPDSPVPPETVAATAEDASAPTKAVGTGMIDEKDPGTVKDSYEFVLENFMEMNKLWVRIQHLPGEGNNKEVRKRRERERNELRILVGTNLVRLSQLENVTSKIYGEVILNQILEHIVTCGDPLSQAYLMDCLVQAFPDEYHIETLPILLNVCPRLRDKVNIRTILQGLMDRLANYLAEEELLDEDDTNQVKREIARDSFGMFEDCVQKVYNARGPKLTAREVIRLQAGLLNFSVKCYPDNTDQVARCLGACVSALRQANASYEMTEGTVINMPDDKIVIKALDDVSVVELEKLLSVPLEKLALKCLRLEHFGDLISFLPWANRRQVSMTLLEAVDNLGATPESVQELEQLFQVIQPLLRDEIKETPMPMLNQQQQQGMSRATHLMANLGVTPNQFPQQQPPLPTNHHLDPQRLKEVEIENSLVCKLVHLIDNVSTDHVYEQLCVARKYLEAGEAHRTSQTFVSLIFAALKLARRIVNGDSEDEATMEEKPAAVEEEAPVVEGEGVEAEAENALATESSPKEVVMDPESSPEAAEKPIDDTVLEPSVVAVTSAKEGQPKVSPRQVLVFVQESISILSKSNAEKAIKLYLEIALAADTFAQRVVDQKMEYSSIALDFVNMAFGLQEETVTNQKKQTRLLELFVGTLLSLKNVSSDAYEGLITRTTQLSAKLTSKADQCRLVALCAYLFYPSVSSPEAEYSNHQRALECLQRALKLADACTNANAADVYLFVELMEHYLLFFEKKNPSITANYITGLAALIKEHLGAASNASNPGLAGARQHFAALANYISSKKTNPETAEFFAPIQMDTGS